MLTHSAKHLKDLDLTSSSGKLRPTLIFERDFDMQAYQVTNDFTILMYADDIFQLHADHTYHSHPLLQLLPENPPRGTGVEIRLYESDPNICHDRAFERRDSISQIPIDKSHGLRKCAILSHDGHAWVPSKALAD